MKRNGMIMLMNIFLKNRLKKIGFGGEGIEK